MEARGPGGILHRDALAGAPGAVGAYMPVANSASSMSRPSASCSASSASPSSRRTSASWAWSSTWCSAGGSGPGTAHPNQQFAGNFEAALQSFAKAAELDPSFARAYAGEAAVAGNLGMFQDAEKYAKLAMEHVDHMTERERYRIRGMYYIRTENWQKCVEEYSELLKLYPADNIGRNNVAACYAAFARHASSFGGGSLRAVELAPKDLLARNNYSLYACYTGDFQTCEREAREVRRLNASSEEEFSASGPRPDRAIPVPPGSGDLPGTQEPWAARQVPRGFWLGRSCSLRGELSPGSTNSGNAGNADLAAKQPDRAADNLAMLAYGELSRGDKSPRSPPQKRLWPPVNPIKSGFSQRGHSSMLDRQQRVENWAPYSVQPYSPNRSHTPN